MTTLSAAPTQTGALTDLTIGDAIAGMARGDFSSVELTEAHLARIDSTNDALHAYLNVTSERALKQAHEADRRRAAGDTAPLLGVPLAIKDVISTEGVETTAGSRILEGYKPPFSATVVRKLEDAGMVMLGKTNTDEFAMGSSTENSGFGPTRNPWNLEKVPGGSSGGSAAAVAARLAMGALGTDTGGSVRQPASLCGVVGLKPSYGRVSRYGLIAYGSSLDQVGMFARTVEDVALLLEAIAGQDRQDSTSLETPVPAYRANLLAQGGSVKGLRVGLPAEYFIEGVQPEVSAAVHKAIAVLQGLGAQIVPISLPNTDKALPVYYLVATAEASANLSRFDGVRFGYSAHANTLLDNYRQSRGHGFGAEVKRRIMLGTYALSAGYYDAYYLKAQQVRTLIKQDFEHAFERVDVIACPVSPTTAFGIGEKTDDPLAMYLTDIFTLTLNLAGICGVSVPCGFDTAGLPIGLQLIGPHLGEEVILRAGFAYQQATAWHVEKPVIQ